QAEAFAQPVECVERRLLVALLDIGNGCALQVENVREVCLAHSGGLRLPNAAHALTDQGIQPFIVDHPDSLRERRNLLRTWSDVNIADMLAAGAVFVYAEVTSANYVNSTDMGLAD